MASDDTALAVAGVVAFGALFGGLLWLGARRSAAPAPPLPNDPNGPAIVPVGLFPDLKAGDAVIVDASRASLPAPFAGLVLAVVDLILTDRSVVSVRALSASVPPATFAGTIPRDAIVRVLPPAIPPGFVPVV